MKRRMVSFIIFCYLTAVTGTLLNAAEPERITFAQSLKQAEEMRMRAQQFHDTGRAQMAVDAYEKALKQYKVIRKDYPDLGVKKIDFGLRFCQFQLSELSTNEGVTPRVNRTETRETPVLPGISIVEIVEKGASDDEKEAVSSGIEEIPPEKSVRTDFPPVITAPDERVDRSAVIASEEIAVQVRDLIDKEDFLDAQRLLKEALYKDAENPELGLLMGLVMSRIGACGDAVVLLEKLSRNYPADKSVKLALSGAYIGLGKINMARIELLDVLKIDPGCSEAYYNMAQVCILLDPPAVGDAKIFYRESVKRGGSPDPAFAARLRGLETSD